MTLLRRALFGLTVSMLLQGLSAPAEACSCTPTPTPAPGFPPVPKPCRDLGVAEKVYVGQVLSVEPGPTQWTVTATLTVGETFKGAPLPVETVTTGINSGICGIPFVAAQHYLLYPRRGSVGMCDGSKNVRFAAAELEILRSGVCEVTPTPTPTPTPTLTPPAVFPGHYKILARHSGKAVVVESASTRNGADIVQWTYGGATTNDEWRIVNIGDSGYYRIVARHSGKAMVVREASTAEGGDIIQWTYGGAATNDEWGLNRTADGYYQLINRHSGKVAEVAGAGTANRADVVQRTANGGAHQEFAIVAVP